MGTYLELVLPEEQRTNELIIDKYYNRVASKERELFPERAEENLKANYQRKISRQNLKEDGIVFLYEPMSLNKINEQNIDLDLDIFGQATPTCSDRIIYGEDIEQFINHLQETKNQLKNQGDKIRWEVTFELQLISLCEFALENGYGVELGWEHKNES